MASMGKTDLYKKKFFVLQELSSAILITDNVSAIANVLLNAAINYAHAEKGSLMLISDHDELTISASQGLPPDIVKNSRVKIGEGIAGSVAQNGQATLVEDIDKEKFSGLQRDHYRTKSFISCPIISKKKILGVLNINDKKDGAPFTIDDFEVLTTLANHAAIALENAHLMSELKAKTSELEDINKKLVETDILKTEFLTRVSHELRTPLNSLGGAIYFLEHTETIAEDEKREFHGIISKEVNKLIAIVENLLGFLRLEDENIIVKKTVIHMADVFGEIRDSKSLMNALSRRGVRLDINLADSRLEVIGDKIKVVQLFSNLIDGLSLFLERGDSIQINADETSYIAISIDLSKPLPDYALSILFDARFIFQMDHADDRIKLYLAKNIVESHRWKISASNSENGCRISIAIPKSAKQTIETYVGQSMDSFVEFVSELLDLDICSIMLTDELSNELTVKSAIGLDDSVIKKTKIKFGDKIAGWVALEGKPLFIENIEDDARFGKTSVSQYSTKSLVSLPLKIGERVVGVLNLNNKKTSEPFTKQDYSTATELSDKISQFLELLYSDHHNEDKLRELFASFEALVKSKKTPLPKRELVPVLTRKILKTSQSLHKAKQKMPNT
jgi:transcriptional regulator with GAF, ATPase, and Fis domain